jgi:uncharacterized protein (DUF2249 family)
MMNKILLDAREMEHPLPFQIAIEHLQKMTETDYLYMINNKKPMPLLEMLKEKGFSHFEHLDSKEIWHIIITKNSTISLESLVDV